MSIMSRPVFRFAPSPNGHLHLGHALSALLNRRAADRLGGNLLLRLEDIDQTRCTPELEAELFEDLAFLEIAFDGKAVRQSERFYLYREVLDRLDEMGLVYPAFLTRAEIKAFVSRHEAETRTPWPRDPDGAPVYPGDAAVLSAAEIRNRQNAGAPFALRLDMRAALTRVGEALTWREAASEGSELESDAHQVIRADPMAWGDVVLARKETPTSYHLSVVVDDACQDITDVLRGQDLYHATSVHRLLQVLLGLPEPVYRHHRLVLGPDGRKLSKSSRDTSLRELRDQGIGLAGITARIGLS